MVLGAGKFVDHASELASFRAYGPPAPGVLVIAVGVQELARGCPPETALQTSAPLDWTPPFSEQEVSSWT